MSPRYEVTFSPVLNLTVIVDAADEDHAVDDAHARATAYVDTVMGDHDAVSAEASMDGIGHDELTEVDPPPAPMRKAR